MSIPNNLPPNNGENKYDDNTKYSVKNYGLNNPYLASSGSVISKVGTWTIFSGLIHGTGRYCSKNYTEFTSRFPTGRNLSLAGLFMKVIGISIFLSSGNLKIKSYYDVNYDVKYNNLPIVEE